MTTSTLAGRAGLIAICDCSSKLFILLLGSLAYCCTGSGCLRKFFYILQAVVQSAQQALISCRWWKLNSISPVNEIESTNLLLLASESTLQHSLHVLEIYNAECII